MSNYANQAHVLEYTTQTEHLLQQNGSKLMPGVTTHNYRGKQAQVVQQFGEAEATEIVNRHADTELSDTPQTSRWLRPSDWGVADMVDKQDIVRSLTDPKSDLSMAQVKGIGRRQDRIIINGITGTNFIGEEGGVTVDATTDGVVKVDASGTNVLTLPKIKECRKNFMKAEVDLDNDPLYWAITAEQFEDLQDIDQNISIDYTNNKVLVNGKQTPFMGFNFLHCELLPLDGNGKRRTLAWAKSGVHYGNWLGIDVQVTQRADKWNNWQVATTATMGATRSEGLKVQEIPCNEP